MDADRYEAEVRRLAADLEKQANMPHTEAMALARRALKESLDRAAARACVDRLLGRDEPILLTLAGDEK